MKNQNQFDNVVPFRESDRFGVYRAEISPSGDLVEKEQLGLAFLKPNGRMFLLKFWMFPKEQYFIVANEDRSAYRILCPNGSHWNEVGTGGVEGSFIRLKLYLLGQEILVCLFPNKAEAKNDAA